MDLNQLKEEILLAAQKNIEELQKPPEYKINRLFVFPYPTGFTNCDGDYVITGPNSFLIKEEKDVRKLIDAASFIIHEKDMFYRSCEVLNITDRVYTHDYYAAQDWISDIQLRINVLKNEETVQEMVARLVLLTVKVEELTGAHHLDIWTWRDIKKLWPDWWGYGYSRNITEIIGKMK